MSTHSLRTTEFFGDSGFMRFIFQRLGGLVSIPGACILWALAQLALFVALCWPQGTLIPKGVREELTLLEDGSTLAYCLALPLIFLLLYYSLRTFAKHLNHLRDVLDPSAPADAHDVLIEIARDLFEPEKARNLRRLFMAGGLAIFLFNAVANWFPGYFYQSPLKWDGIEYPITYVVSRAFVLFVWGYALPLWLSEVYLQFLVIYRIHATMAERGWIKVSPYALDRFAGLRNLSQSASRPGYLVVAAGVFFVAPALRVFAWGHSLHAGNYVGLAHYGVLAAGGLLLPLFLVHRVLARKQLEMLHFLSVAFDDINAKVAHLMSKGEPAGLADAELNRAVETVERLRRQWSDLPLWPLSVSLVMKLAIAAAPPAFLYLQEHLKSLPL